MTDPERRKKRSEELLKRQGIPINPSLSAIEPEQENSVGHAAFERFAALEKREKS
jgi:hypothetical protein